MDKEDGSGSPESKPVASRSAEIFFQTAVAKTEAEKARARAQFTEMVGAKPVAEDFVPLRQALEGLAEKCFGKPLKDIEIKLTPEQEENLRRVTKDIQEGLRQKGIDPRIIYGDNIIE